MPTGAGVNYMALQSLSGGTASIIQAFAVTPGKTYALTFYNGSRVSPYGANTATAQLDNGTAGTFGAAIWTKAVANGQTWQYESAPFTSSQASVRIKLNSTASSDGMFFVCKFAVTDITYMLIKEVVDAVSTGPYTITWSEIATSLSTAALTNCTFRVFTVLRDPTNVTQAL